VPGTPFYPIGGGHDAAEPSYGTNAMIEEDRTAGRVEQPDCGHNQAVAVPGETVNS
jgi:hypothetical protein